MRPTERAPCEEGVDPYYWSSQLLIGTVEGKRQGVLRVDVEFLHIRSAVQVRYSLAVGISVCMQIWLQKSIGYRNLVESSPSDPSLIWFQ
jgi:hypothetical protein